MSSRVGGGGGGDGGSTDREYTHDHQHFDFDAIPHNMDGDKLVLYLDRFPCPNQKLLPGKPVAVLDANTGKVYVSPDSQHSSPFVKHQGPIITATSLQKHGVEGFSVVTIQHTGHAFKQCP
jgi:hypothetical protein